MIQISFNLTTYHLAFAVALTASTHGICGSFNPQFDGAAQVPSKVSHVIFNGFFKPATQWGPGCAAGIPDLKTKPKTLNAQF